MFINCPFCKALVATDPATDLPPERCPRCAEPLRAAMAEMAADAAAAAARASQVSAMPALAVDAVIVDSTADAVAGASPHAGLSSQIHHIVAGEAAQATPPAVAPIATLLKAAEPAQAAPGSPAAATEVATAATPAATVASPAGSVTTVPGDGPATRPASAEKPAPEAAPAAAPMPDRSAQGRAVFTLPATPPSPPPAAARPAKAAPSFARAREAGAHAGFGWKPVAAIAALAVLLLLQLLLADRARLASDARWRPLVSTLCGAFGCSLPPWREPSAFTVLQRDVHPHPGSPGALRVTATFRNDARWPQPWPRLRLTLSDVDGHPVARRDFAASDYLGGAPAQAELGSGQSASIAMDIAEPTRHSVAFDFELF
jgi:hypothetical protein